MFLLIDCNNFYVSCERVFNPKLNGKPVLVLSNNDGCVVARSSESKKLGVRMTQPMFELRDLIKKHHIQWLSSNYTLYASMSERVMNCIQIHCPNIEIYSIDEAFVNFAGSDENELFLFSEKLRKIVIQWTGIPVSIGIGPTKTLAKMANVLAKKSLEGVFSLASTQDRKTIFETFSVGDVWGIGRKSSAKLYDLDITTVERLLQHPVKWLRKQFGLGMEKTITELQGVSCIALEELVSKKAIQSTRSFSRPITTLEELSEALSAYAAIAAEKCRAQKGLAQGLCVSISTSRYKPNQEFYAKQKTLMLSVPSQDTRVITNYALTLLKVMYKSGFYYNKCGIHLLDIIPETHLQTDILIHHLPATNRSIMKVLDNINQKYGKSTVHLAAEGFKKTWAMKSSKRSPNYTTQWHELAVAFAV